MISNHFSGRHKVILTRKFSVNLHKLPGSTSTQPFPQFYLLEVLSRYEMHLAQIPRLARCHCINRFMYKIDSLCVSRRPLDIGNIAFSCLTAILIGPSVRFQRAACGLDDPSCFESDVVPWRLEDASARVRVCGLRVLPEVECSYSQLPGCFRA